jgi:5-(carboxyamino)imidazole ribonucleotide mutase
MSKPLVGVIMGSDSDLDVMSEAAKILDDLDIPNEVRILSAHRTTEEMLDYAAAAKGRGVQIIIAGAGGSAHLGGMVASHTTLPVLSVPVKRDNHDHEALWSNIKMPPGITLATMPENGGKNAGLFAAEILALQDKTIAEKYAAFRKNLHDEVVAKDKKLQTEGWKKYLGK